MADFNLTNLALKVLCPTNVIMMDDKGLPSVMVRIPKFKISDVITGGATTTHPAFIINGVEVPEIFISKYQNVVYNGRAYSLPLENPQTNIDFDTSLAACAAKGLGWHLMTRAEWALIALWCRKNNLMPNGNNNFGKDVSESTYTAIPASDTNGGSYESGEQIGRVLTGSGSPKWSHNGDQSGIWDLNGNISEWVGGYRTVEGEIQILDNNDAADMRKSQAANSSVWKAITSGGDLATPGTADTLKWNYTTLPTGGNSAGFELNTVITKKQSSESDGYGALSFSTLGISQDILVQANRIRSLALLPCDANDHGGDFFNMRNIGERLMICGGYWSNGAGAGVFYANGIGVRGIVSQNIGFRSAYANIPA